MYEQERHCHSCIHSEKRGKDFPCKDCRVLEGHKGNTDPKYLTHWETKFLKTLDQILGLE